MEIFFFLSFLQISRLLELFLAYEVDPNVKLVILKVHTSDQRELIPFSYTLLRSERFNTIFLYFIKKHYVQRNVSNMKL